MLDIPIIEKIKQLEAHLLRLPQVHMPVTHDFCDGLYARTMEVPCGTILTGATHRSENFLIVRKGSITVWTEDGMRTLFEGNMVKSNAGMKRVGVTHSDVVMTTFHFNPTNETNPEELWELFTIEDGILIDNEIQLNLFEAD